LNPHQPLKKYIEGPLEGRVSSYGKFVMNINPKGSHLQKSVFRKTPIHPVAEQRC
jgi:hypothetical protein